MTVEDIRRAVSEEQLEDQNDKRLLRFAMDRLASEIFNDNVEMKIKFKCHEEVLVKPRDPEYVNETMKIYFDQDGNPAFDWENKSPLRTATGLVKDTTFGVLNTAAYAVSDFFKGVGNMFAQK